MGFDDCVCSFTIEDVLFILRKCNPLECSHLAVFGNHPGDAGPRVVAVLPHHRDEVAVGIRILCIGTAPEQGCRRRVGGRRRRGCRRDTMKCAKCIHCREILTFGHFVLLVFNHAHQGGKIGMYGHLSIRSRVCLV